MSMQPAQILFQNQITPRVLPSCDHYAGTEKFMRKALLEQSTSATKYDVTLDCEDGASAGNEIQHANLVTQLLETIDPRAQRVGVRVHDVTHPTFLDELNIILPRIADKLAYIVLPKVDSAEQIYKASTHINQLSQTVRSTHIPIHVIVESPEAVSQVHEIAALEQVECISFGIMDFVSAHLGAIPASAMRSPNQFQHPLICQAKVAIATACHRFGKVASHNVCTEFQSQEQTFSDAKRALSEFGFTRMWSIHPSQINQIVAAMSPSLDEVDEALAIIRKAQQNAWGPINHLGRLHDRASYRYYWTIIQRARNANVSINQDLADLYQGDTV